LLFSVCYEGKTWPSCQRSEAEEQPLTNQLTFGPSRRGSMHSIKQSINCSMPKSLVPHKNTGHGLTHSPLKAKLVEAKSRDVSALGKN